MRFYLKNRIESKDKSFVFLQKNTNITVSSINSDNFKSKFNRLVDKGKIKRGSFYENSWILNCEEYSATVHFMDNVSDFLSNAIRFFLILQLYDLDFSTKYVANNQSRLISILKTTQFFNKNGFALLEKFFSQLSDREKFNYSSIALTFISFAELTVPNYYFEFFESVPVYEGKARDLPDYRSTILFDHLLHDFYSDLNLRPLNKTEKYFYPVLLWWDITKIIPMRISEFSSVRRIFCYYSYEKKRYVVKINRKKRKGKRAIAPLEIITTTPEVYDMVRRYNEITEDFNYHPHLFFPKSHYQFRNNRKTRMAKTNYFTNGYMRQLLKKFFYEVIRDQYGFHIISKRNFNSLSSGRTIQIIKPGDTRHFAFASLKLQGINPLTIARLGGHAKIEQQNTYYGHLNKVAESHVAILADLIKKYQENDEPHPFINFSDTQEMVLKSRYFTLKKGKNGRPVEGGYCQDLANSIFPNDCPDYCINCHLFKLDQSKRPITLRKLKGLAEKSSSEMESLIETLTFIGLNMRIDTNNLTFDPGAQADLFSVARDINQNIKNQAILKSYVEDT